MAGEQRVSVNVTQSYAAFAVGAPTEVADSATLLIRGIFQFFRP
jgi:hypothetical protein